MARLTDTQLIVLSKAAAREDGLASVPNEMNKAAATKVGTSLVAHKLMREVRAEPGMPIWRHDNEDRPISLGNRSRACPAARAENSSTAITLR